MSGRPSPFILSIHIGAVLDLQADYSKEPSVRRVVQGKQYADERFMILVDRIDERSDAKRLISI